MSIDGPGLLESDLAHDVYNRILDLWDAGVEIDKIRSQLRPLEEFATDPMDREIFLAACIKALWEIGQLPSALRLELLQVVEKGASLAQWAEADDATLSRQRRSVLNRLLKQTELPKAKPRARRKYATISNKLYAVGDCLELVIDERAYRGVVCKILERRGACEYALLVMHPKTRSTRKSFESGKFYGHFIGTPTGSMVGPHIIRLEHRMLVRAGNPFSVVARVELDAAKFMTGSFGGILDMGDVVADFERTQDPDSPFVWSQLHAMASLLRDVG